MGFILLLLSCWGAVVHDLPFVRISDNSPIDVFVVGEPKQQYQWKVTPTVRVCKTTEMPLYRVQQAIHYWENLGYNFDGIYYDSKPDCMEPRFGEIILKKNYCITEIIYCSLRFANFQLRAAA